MANNNCTPATKRRSDFKDLTGFRFERLTVIKEVENKKPIRWECLCDCGTRKSILSNHLRHGRIKSCGCLRSDTAKTLHVTHGASALGRKTPEYIAWMDMKHRCYSPNATGFKNYGGRGISVCDEWLNDFQSFYAHVGLRPSKNHSLDRIDTNKNYEPGNVKWSTAAEQNNNKRSNKNLTWNGSTKTYSMWAKEVGLNERNIAKRLRRGWCIDCTLSLPAFPAGSNQATQTCTHKLSQ